MEWMEKSKRSEATLTVRMKHDDDYVVNEDSNLSHSVRASNKKDSQRTTTLTGNKQRDYENEGSTTHEDSCIGINYVYAHTHVKCFKSFQTLGFALCFMSSILILVAVTNYSILTCTRIPCRDTHTHCENGSFKALSLHLSRRLQQTAVSCKRSKCNKKKRSIKTNSWNSFVWGFIQWPNTTGFSVLSYRFACILICRLSLIS